MLEYKKIAIFSQPRTGTKLVASILKDFGYHVYSEWFAYRSMEIIKDRAVRRTEFAEGIISASERQYKHLLEHKRRYNLYKNLAKREKSVITIWPDNMAEFPFMLYEFADYHWVCIRRNPWEQMLSWYISSKNKNFDALMTNKPVTFKETSFRKTYWDYYRIQGLQDWLVENRHATLIDFDELIKGTSSAFGVNYRVASVDENMDLESLVKNLSDVKSWYNKFEDQRLGNAVDNNNK